MRPLFFLSSVLCLIGFQAVLVWSEKITDLHVKLEARHQLQLSITFDHDDSTYSFPDLRLVTLISNERTRSTSSSSTTFRTASGRPTDSATWATVTLLDNNRIIGLFYVDNGLRTIHVDTIWGGGGDEDGRRLDMSNYDSSSSRPCATITPDELKRDTGITERNARRVNSVVETRPPEDPNGKDVARTWAKLGLRKRRNATRRNLELDSWFSKGPDCYNRDDVTRKVSIGIVVDAAMERRVGLLGFPSTEKYVEALVATASAVYLAQMNIEIVVGQVLKPSDAVTAAEIALTSARYVANSCKTTYNDLTGEAIETVCCDDRLGIAQRLELIRAWGATLPLRSDSPKQAVRQAHWHLLTDCHPSPGYVGQTFIGTLCHGTHAAGLSSFGPNSQPSLAHWRIFAHELGHAFNASHSFENGQGRTGGIMDYGNGLYNEEYQFHPLKRDEVCSEIDAEVDSCMFFETKEGRCGDGIVEKFRGEECECPGNNITQCPDCANCKLIQPSECVRGSMCCSSNGRFLPSSTQCSQDGRPGVCVLGTCQITVCGDKLSVCAADPCRVRCAPASQPTACSESFLNLPDLTPCPLSSSVWGHCIQGQCSPVQPSSKTPKEECRDLVQPWWDADGTTFTCNWYQARPTMCAQYGFRMRNFGYTPAEACCGCGGGTTGLAQRNTHSPTPLITTKSPTVPTKPVKTKKPTTAFPTKSPTQSPTKVVCPYDESIAACAAAKNAKKCKKLESELGACKWCVKQRKKKKNIARCVPVTCKAAKICQLMK